MNRTLPFRFHSVALALLAVATVALSTSAQTTVEPGTSATIGEATDATQSVSDCSGLNFCGVEFNPDGKTMGAITRLTGIASTKTARASLLNQFVVSGSSGRVLGARLAGNVSWSGDLESIGAIGARASVNVGISIVDLTNNLTVGGQTLLDEQCETFVLLDSCLRRITGSKAVNIPFQVQAGREYEIRFTLECESNSGLGDANCVFNQNGTFPLSGGQVSRSDLTLTVEADIVGLLEEIRDLVNMLKDDVAVHDADMKDAADRNFGATLESIRLLLTPQGQRATDLPVCDGMPCAFPHGANASGNGSCDNGNGNGNCGNGQDSGNGDPGDAGGPGDTGDAGGTGDADDEENTVRGKRPNRNE